MSDALLMKEIVPADLQDRPYLKDWLDKPQSPEMFAEVFKKLDGAEKLVGKKTGVPEADAPPAEWDQFFSKFRPAKADDYDIPVKDPEKADVELNKVLKEAFHAGNLSKAQASKFQATLLPALEARHLKSVEAQKKLDDDFEALAKSTFGADKPQVLERASTAIKELVPQALQGQLEKLDNPSLMILAGVVNSFLNKYAAEDKPGNSSNGGGGDTTNLREEAMKLMALPEYKDAFHSKHDATVAKVQELYKQIGAQKK